MQQCRRENSRRSELPEEKTPKKFSLPWVGVEEKSEEFLSYKYHKDGWNDDDKEFYELIITGKKPPFSVIAIILSLLGQNDINLRYSQNKYRASKQLDPV